MLINGVAQINPVIVDSIWVVAQREAMIIKGVQVPKEIVDKYEKLKPSK